MVVFSDSQGNVYPTNTKKDLNADNSGFACANLDERCACLRCTFTWYGSVSKCPVCGSTGNDILVLETSETEARRILELKNKETERCHDERT